MYSNNRHSRGSRNSSFRGSSNRGNRPQRRNPSLDKIFNPHEMIQASAPVATVATNDEYIAQNSFDDFRLDSELLKNIYSKNYDVPTPIQDQIIPHIINGKDVVGIANTGTGKTAAFLIPLINTVLQNRNKRVLIVAPTRELAAQIQEEFNQFAYGLKLHSVLLIGGIKIFHQKKDMRQPYNFIIGTPGRIKDMVRERLLDLGRFDTVVLDEVDHLVDIGFIKDIQFFINLLPKQRHSLFFSATVDGKTKDILNSFVHDPVTVSVKKNETTENVEQGVIKVESQNKKIDQLHDLLVQKNYEKVIIFGRTKWGVEKTTKELVRRGFKAGSIHGNKNQNQRLRTLDAFKRNEISILFATDVAARGLDIDDVSHVINYDLPATREDYIHRIGRTGRANKRGTALTFI